MADVVAFGDEAGWPVVVKAASGGYDGRGVAIVDDIRSVEDAVQSLGGGLVLEELVPFDAELAVMVARNAAGEVACYPPVATIQRDAMCAEVVSPAPVPAWVRRAASELAESLATEFGLVGVMAVELFLVGSDLVINELATRPHNTAHHTIEAAETSQFEQHLRAVLGWPLGATRARARAAAMVNVVGAADGSDPRRHLARALGFPGAHVHLYGKDPQPGRKLGHVTALGATGGQAREVANRAAALLGSPIRRRPLGGRGMSAPVVGVIMGSASDLDTMRPAAEVLTEFGVPVELRVVSAHRTPDDMADYARSASGRGLRVVIAGAGGAAHLPGMVAALTELPVIGVPVPLRHLDGLDSLLSIVQMPTGVPVATVAIGAARNAGLLAVRILALADPELASRLVDDRARRAAVARAQDHAVSLTPPTTGDLP